MPGPLMPGPRRLRTRLLLGHLAVVAVGVATLALGVTTLAPPAFDAAMGHGMGGTMDGMMDPIVQAAFRDAVSGALLAAAVVATLAAIVISVAVSGRLSGPIRRLAAASRRIADGHYAERVPVASGDEIGELAASFNAMAGALESNERRRLELVGDVAHELRTPIATLDGYLEGLQDGVVAPGAETWALLRGQTTRLARLVEDLQELWRAEAQQLPMRPEAVDPAALLREVLERFGPTAAERGITLRLETPRLVPPVRADRERLAQVIDNLVDNAIRYGPDGSEVVARIERRGDEDVLGVSDQGPGLEAEQLARVFERFYRVDPSRSRALGGSGIGLAIAKALSEAMGGRIWAESAGPGRGATFLVALPLAAAPS